MTTYKTCGNCGGAVEQHQGGTITEMWVHRKGTGHTLRYFLNCSDNIYGVRPEFKGSVAEPEYGQEQLV